MRVPPDHGNPEDVLFNPAVHGTKAVLAACSRCPSVKKVIMTSCISALSDEFDNDRVYTEKDWNTMSSQERNPQAFCKVSAERAAWEFIDARDGTSLKRDGESSETDSPATASAAPTSSS